MSSRTTGRRIAVIDPHTEDGGGKQHSGSSNNNNIVVVPEIQGKKYCPRDQSLLIFSPALDTLMCEICGFIIDTAKHKSGSIPSILSETRENGSLDNISMKLIPVGGGSRKQIEEVDPDVKRLQDKGYVLQDYDEVKSEEGTYNAQRELEERQKLISRSRYDTWTVR